MLKVDDIHQYYGGSHILRGVSFEARLGEVTVVLGRNGVGKTTLLKSLMGVVPVKTGRIGLDGHDITHAPSYERVRRGVGYVPQGREIFSRLTVEENLRMGLATRPGGTRIPAELFELFPVLKQMLPDAASSPATRQLLDNMVNQQALMISYNNDFHLMMLITLAAVPLALMLRKPKMAAPAGAPAAHMD